jgi:dephospho-CoA kinase
LAAVVASHVPTPDDRDMLIVGLTGNIASGKSSVASLLAARGATIIDADLLARQAVLPGTPAHHKITERWGGAVLLPDGQLDRAALRLRVFEDPDQLAALNAMVQQLRRQAVEAARQAGAHVVVCDIPLLFEAHLAAQFPVIILVDAPRAVRLERLVRDRGLSQDEAMSMIAAQMPSELKRARAHYVIDNEGTRDDLAGQVDRVWASVTGGLHPA